MLGILKDVLPLITSSVKQLLDARRKAHMQEVGEILYSIQYAVSDIIDTASRLERDLISGRKIPEPTPWPNDLGESDTVAKLLTEQASNVSRLGKRIKRLIETGGNALDPSLTKKLSLLVEAKTGAISQLAVSLAFMMYPESIGAGTMHSLCVEYNGLVQISTGRFVQQSVVDQHRMIEFILEDYAACRIDLEEIHKRLVELYESCFDPEERLAIGRAVRKKESKLQQ